MFHLDTCIANDSVNFFLCFLVCRRIFQEIIEEEREKTRCRFVTGNPKTQPSLA